MKPSRAGAIAVAFRLNGLLILAAAFVLAQPHMIIAQQNTIDTVIRGAIGAAKSKQAAADWQKVDPATQACMNTMLGRHGTSIASLIQQGILPGDPRLLQAKANCEQVTRQSFKEDIPCTLRQPNGVPISTRCDEAFSIQQSNGQLRRLSKQEAIVELANNHTIAVAPFERTDALAKRQEAERLAIAEAKEKNERIAEQRREEERQAVSQRRADEERKLEILRLEAERAKAQAQAAKIQADAEAQRRADEERQRKLQVEAEDRRIAAEKEKVRSEQLTSQSLKISESRRSCKSTTVPAGLFSSLTGKSSALKMAVDLTIPLHQAVTAILPFAADETSDGHKALVARIVAQTLKWNSNVDLFKSAIPDFIETIWTLQKDCKFEALDYLASRNVASMKNEVQFVLGYDASSPNADLVNVLKLTPPDVLQRAAAGGAVAGGDVFAAEERRQVEEERQRKAKAAEKAAAEENAAGERMRLADQKLISAIGAQQIVDCGLGLTLLAPMIKSSGDEQTFRYSQATARAYIKLSLSISPELRAKIDFNRVKTLGLTELSTELSPCVNDERMRDLVMQEMKKL